MRARLLVRQLRRSLPQQRWCAAACDKGQSDEALARAELAKRAHRDVQIARRRRREADDELVLFQSATAAGYLPPTGGGDEAQRKRQAIDRYLTDRAEEILIQVAKKQPVSSLIDFELEVAPSRDLPQPVAGDGVFVKSGEIPAGTFLAFYPGSVYLPHEVRWCGGDGPLLERAKQPTSSHIIGRVGGVIIDGLWSQIEVPASEFDIKGAELEDALATRIKKENVTSEVGLKAARDDLEAYCEGLASSDRRQPSVLIPEHAGIREKVRSQNPLAVGEMINHPPDGRPSNVIGWPVDLDLGGKGLMHVAPNTFGLRPQGLPAPGAPCPFTVVMVAACTLKPGDELYLDYGMELLELEDIPPWFAPASLRGDAIEADPSKNPAVAIKAELHAWRDSFERTHGRKPNRNDLSSDRVASALFETFQSYRKLGDL